MLYSGLTEHPLKSVQLSSWMHPLPPPPLPLPLPLPPPRPNSPHLYNTRRAAGIEFLCYFSRQFDTRMY